MSYLHYCFTDDTKSSCEVAKPDAQNKPSCSTISESTFSGYILYLMFRMLHPIFSKIEVETRRFCF